MSGTVRLGCVGAEERHVMLDFTGAPIVKGSARFAFDRTCRMEMRRWWVENPTRWAAWLMLNPSNAGAVQNDPTAVRVTHFTRSWGYDGWIGVNVYPFIASKPAAMWHRANWQARGPDWEARDAMQANEAHLEEVARMATLRMVAFGTGPATHDEVYLEQCLEMFMQPSDVGSDEHLYCLGLTKGGHPLHPMARGKSRVPDDRQPSVWRRT